MSDQVVGIAVLDARDKNQYLYFTCQRGADGAKFELHLPVSMEGPPGGLPHTWKYRVDGDTLHCSPSILCQAERFHNTFNWSVKFVVYDHARYKNMIDHHDAVNSPGVDQ